MLMMFATSAYAERKCHGSTVPQFHWKSYFLSKKTFLFFIPLNFCYFQWFCGTAYERSNNNIQIINQSICFISLLVAVPQRFHSPLCGTVFLLPSHSCAAWVAQLCHCGSNAVPPQQQNCAAAVRELCHGSGRTVLLNMCCNFIRPVVQLC